MTKRIAFLLVPALLFAVSCTNGTDVEETAEVADVTLARNFDIETNLHKAAFVEPGSDRIWDCNIVSGGRSDQSMTGIDCEIVAETDTEIIEGFNLEVNWDLNYTIHPSWTREIPNAVTGESEICLLLAGGRDSKASLGMSCHPVPAG